MGGAEQRVLEEKLTDRRGEETWNHRKERKFGLCQKSVNLETQHLDNRMMLWSGIHGLHALWSLWFCRFLFFLNCQQWSSSPSWLYAMLLAQI